MDRRHLARTAAGLGLTTLALAAAAPAAAQSPPAFGSEKLPLKSDNVTPLLTIPVGKPIGARFRDNYMYLTGSEGLSIYDISNPKVPVPAGFLPLPHFENEDVDLGGNILLISNDPSESVGVLYVIDISNPHAPIVKGVMFNGVGDGQAADAITQLTDLFGFPPVVPGDSEETTGIGHTASCIKADCSWAYLAGTSRGIEIVDLTDPAHPVQRGRFVPEITGKDSPSVVDTTHDVQVDANGIAWIVGADGTAGYDVTDPMHPRLVARTDEKLVNSGQGGLPDVTLPDNPVFGGYIIGGNGETPIDLIHHDSLRLGTVYHAPPTPPGQTPGPGSTGTTGGGTSGGGGTTTGTGGSGGSGTTTAGGGGTTTSSGGTTAASQPGTTIAIQPRRPSAARKRARARALARCRKLKRAAKRRACARVRRTYDRRSSARAVKSDGAFTLEQFRQIPGKAYPAGGDSPLFGVVEEDYNRPTCKGAGSFQTWGMTDEKTSKGAGKLAMLDLYETELDKLLTDQSGWAPVTGLCSAHYFDYRDGIVAGGWYEEGTRFLDVRDPTNIKQVGYWVPTKGETWSVLFPPTDPTGTIVYALDFARGMDVLQLDRKDLRPRAAPVRRSWLRAGKGGFPDGRTSRTGLSTGSRFGYLCRLAVSP